MPRKTPVTAAAVPIVDALRASAPLGRLAERMRLSKAMYAAVAPTLPPGLSGSVSAGPVDAEGWSLLCANAAVAAKLRQLVPRLEQRLVEAGLAVASVRIKVQPL